MAKCQTTGFACSDYYFLFGQQKRSNWRQNNCRTWI